MGPSLYGSGSLLDVVGALSQGVALDKSMVSRTGCVPIRLRLGVLFSSVSPVSVSFVSRYNGENSRPGMDEDRFCFRAEADLIDGFEFDGRDVSKGVVSSVAKGVSSAD